jgi:hypothetical protein
MPDLRIGTRLLALCLAAVGEAFSGCSRSPVSPSNSVSSSPSSSPSNDVPTIAAISPTSALAGGAAFTITVSGINFLAGSVVSFGGKARTTTFVSATQLTAAVPADAIATAGTALVTVTNLGPGPGEVSAPVNLSVTLQPVDPMEGQYALSVSVDSLGPECATLPDEAKHRAYTATMALRSDGNFAVSLSGGSFLSGPICTSTPSGLGCNQFLASRAGTVQFSLLNENDDGHGGHIVERIPQTGWIELIGNLTSPVSNDMMLATGDGSLWFCSDTSSYPFPCPHYFGCAVHDLRMTFVRQ